MAKGCFGTTKTRRVNIEFLVRFIPMGEWLFILTTLRLLKFILVMSLQVFSLVFDMQFNQTLFSRKVKAFTLVEMLVVLVIIGILVLLALPNLINVTTRAKTVEAKTQLGYLQTLEKSYFYEHSKYSKDLSEIGFTQEKLAPEGQANYRIEITNATGTTFTARATSVVDFNGNGTFNVWEIDQDKNLKEVTPD
jgi:type IV pilus assembly protein PilE